ncbi:Protein kinase domain-containing protein, partial [Trichostrongylus colubriformis]
MNLLDRNLEKLREQTTAFKPATTYYVAHEVLAALAFLHGLRYAHRDVKLTNICIGAGQMNTRIYLIDYGETVKIGKKIRYGTPDGYTLPYWSLDAHKRG